MKYCRSHGERRRLYLAEQDEWRGILQMPDSSPTAKQLLSLLNETERTAVGFDASMGGRTFMAMGQDERAM